MTQLLTTRDVLRMLGMSRTTLHRLRTGGAFPEPLKLPNGHSVRWRLADVEAWIENQAKSAA